MQIDQLIGASSWPCLAAAVAWPVAPRAQPQIIPVVGFLGAPSAAPYARYVAAIHQGLEVGYVEGQNVKFQYQWAEGRYERLPELAAELVREQVSVIIPIGGAPPTVAAKAATTTIPIVFAIGGDPFELGLVGSLNRPGGNLTGVAKKAAHAVDQQLVVLNASTEGELQQVFASIAKEGVAAVLVGADKFFTSKPALFVLLTARHAIPAIYPWRSHVDAGGLMSYGASLVDSYRQTGVYAGHILKGAKPADLPILEPTKFELVINLQSAKAIGLTMPPSLLARADEVIE